MALFGFGSKGKGDGAAEAREVTLEDGGQVTVAQVVDCIGDSCPRPQLMTRKAIGAAASGDVIEVLVDNPSSMEAIPPMLSGLQAVHLETRKGDRRWEIYIRKE
ncbi:MAG TPA: sulfurtransferase TusA family protein [Sedimenticola thiotaurini]|uniref:Sulfurtransferase TusA family protein n=1 Tax=Sedimenticola thiotaurini TaxID=1543721 RepID=A0A831RK37_9GAMM|nr:sulfurtransferase TusA family protein [Sedimenticola thiotaurini]